MIKYFKNISLRLFFVLLGIFMLLTAWAWLENSTYIQFFLAANLVMLSLLAWWLARSISRIRQYAEAMAANRTTPQPQFGDSYFYRLVHAISHLRNELNHRQRIENYVLGLTHELKTPLTAQHAALEMLQESKLTTEQQQLVNRIVRNMQRQQQLITHLLELARLENCDTLQVCKNIDLTVLIQQATHDCKSACYAKNLTFRLPENEKYSLQGDPILLRQAVDNLLYNALDFANKNSEIRIQFTTSPNQLCLHIDNLGDPIPDYALAKIPQRFYSLPRANGRRSSGLGLSFVSEIMRLHNGFFRLHNQENGVRASLIFHLTGHDS